MLLEGGSEVDVALANVLNELLETGTDRHETFLTITPKGGDLKDPSNWMPIAVLSICYKVFAKIIHGRIAAQLEAHQPPEQMAKIHRVQGWALDGQP